MRKKKKKRCLQEEEKKQTTKKKHAYIYVDIILLRELKTRMAYTRSAAGEMQKPSIASVRILL